MSNRQRQPAPDDAQPRGPAPAHQGVEPEAGCHPKPTDWADGDDAAQDHRPPCPEGYEDRQPDKGGQQGQAEQR